MGRAILGFFLVTVAAVAPSLIFSLAPYFKRTDAVRVRRFRANFILWLVFAPIVAMVVYFLRTEAAIKAALEIFDWWLFTSIGLACLVLCLITLVIACKRDDPLRTQAAQEINAVALTEFSSFVLNNGQSLWVIAAFLVAAGGELATTVAYCIVSVVMTFIAWSIAP